jgi:hypothetical protein
MTDVYFKNNVAGEKIVMTIPPTASDTQVGWGVMKLLELDVKLSDIRWYAGYAEDGSALSTFKGLIDQNWGIDMSTFPFPHHNCSFRPDGDALSWDTRLLATIAILSEFTAGQADQISSLLCNAVELRVGKSKQQLLVLKDIDVKRVIRDIMQPVREDEGEDDKELAKKPKSVYKQCKKGEKKAKEDDGPVTMGEALDEIVMDDVNEGMGKVTLPE